MASQQQNGNGSTRHIGDVLEDVVPEQSATPRPIGTDGLRTGLGALDDLLGDLPYCEIVGVVGRCGVVTDALLTIARNAAVEGASVLYCTSHSAPEVALALASAISHVPFASLLGGTYSEGEARMLDQAIGEIKNWDLQFIEFDDRPKGFLRDLHRAITQAVGFDGEFSGRPRLVVIDSLLDAYLHEWRGAVFSDALNELNEISVQSRATLLFGFAGECFAGGLDFDSALPHFAYATIELKELYGCERTLQPELTIRGEGFAYDEVLLARNAETRCVTDLLAPSYAAPGWGKGDRAWTVWDAYEQGGRSRPALLDRSAHASRDHADGNALHGASPRGERCGARRAVEDSQELGVPRAPGRASRASRLRGVYRLRGRFREGGRFVLSFEGALQSPSR